jgi:hypothetical protein
MHVKAVLVVNLPLSKRGYVAGMIAVGNNWMDIAEFCADAVASAAHGEREATLDQAVALLRTQNPPIVIAKQTLRTALLAHRFVNMLESTDARLAQLLRTMPAAAVETIARWYRRDQEKAKVAAQLYVGGVYSLRSLIEAEGASRSPKQPLSGAAEKTRYAEAALKRLTTFNVSAVASPVDGLIQSLLEWKQDKPGENSPGGVAATGTMTVLRSPPVRADGKHPSPVEWDIRCAVLIVGPYSTPEQYQFRAEEWCLRALGLTFFHPMVALVLPEAGAWGRFEPILARSGTHKVFLLIEKPAARGRTKTRKAA